MIMLMNIKLEKSWQSALSDYGSSAKFETTIGSAYKAYSVADVYPARGDIFNALDKTPIPSVKVVILGQDPYHGPGQAHGLAFSVPSGVPMPPSLRNIFKELSADTGARRTCTDLSDWAEQGVLLLNSTLTVLSGKPASHSHLGWESFTDEIIKVVSDTQGAVVFILWGAHARAKRELIDTHKHLILESAHPSPLSAHRGFFNSKPFSKTNNYLKNHGKNPIEW
jgi:uracil-DNA glycosylase